ncbi:hypothetical protein PsorP6_015604 [Peronosclerospora sorghi]|uniref:Uncharacterized protein n=1 Tax=Peronosclerospora sorghi TaxID=230839 RepID=A0ACC0WR66_9STRA|nr:hypothetical protein PsorP6_015604 [Peronosclerospora sorghi]
MAPGRVRKELEECQRDSHLSGVSAVPVTAASLTELRGSIQGPDATPYAGGHFELEIRIPPKYPFEPPQMRFLTKIWHPNISSQTGMICLDILKDAWSPALTIKTALLSIQALLSAAEPLDPQDAEVAKMYLENQAQFLNTARFWTETYAKKTETGNDAALLRLIDMGFPSEKAKAALVAAKGDENAAIETLLRRSTRCFGRHFFLEFLLELLACIPRDLVRTRLLLLERNLLEFPDRVATAMYFRHDVRVTELELAELAHGAKHGRFLWTTSDVLVRTALVCIGLTRKKREVVVTSCRFVDGSNVGGRTGFHPVLLFLSGRLLVPRRWLDAGTRLPRQTT